MARFYELKTNKPLYFTRDYVLTYDDSDMPTHYAFKVSGNRIERIENLYNRIREKGRKTILAERTQMNPVDGERIQEIIHTLDEQGRWIERGTLENPENRREEIETDILSCRTFNRNLTLLARYVRSQK